MVEGEQAKIAKITSLEERVTSLTLSLEAYHILRNRFLSTFRRDKLGNATEADFRLISEGNRWAHGGDATADALLYEGRLRLWRVDVSTYEKLYGLDPARVAQISKFGVNMVGHLDSLFLSIQADH